MDSNDTYSEDQNVDVGSKCYSRIPQQQLHPNLALDDLLRNQHQIYQNNAPLQQQMNFSPAVFTHFCSTHANAPTSTPGYTNLPMMPTYLATPGLPQVPTSPGFLTGAGYHVGLTGSPILGGLRLPGHPSCSPGQAGTPLHFAAIVGDKQKLNEILQDDSINFEVRDRWGRVALVYAVLGNHLEVLEMLLRAGARPDAIDSHKCTPLHFAAYKGHLGCIKALLHAVESKGVSHVESQGGVWLAQDMRGVTPLHHAAYHNNYKCLQALLKYATPGTLDAVDHKKRTPLHWAAAYGAEENVRLLIKHGANNLMPDQEGKTPLHWAAMSRALGAKGCVRTLIAAAPSSVNWQDFDGITALHLAVAEARLDTVDVILSVTKCNVDLTDNQFRTALHWACNRGDTPIVGRLLECGAHLGALDVYEATPLHYAAQLNHGNTVELLVRRPCVRDAPTKEGHTALLWAAASGADKALTVMVRHGASLTQSDPRGCTALHIAAGAGHVSTVGVLLRLHSPPDVCANDGRTPLLHAAQAGHAQIVKLLAKAGVLLDHRDNEGQCALHHAVIGGHLYLAQILIRAGTNVNVQDYHGRTPLHMAAYRGLSDIMFLLIENRGDVNARDHEGQTPLHWAAQQGHLGAVNTLLDFHAYPNYTQTSPDRYTPVDCAYVAEQLEIAQVLMEAGGVSVTRIMEIAATKIQAHFKGYMTRKKHKVKMKGEKVTSQISDGSFTTSSNFVHEITRATPPETSYDTNDSSHMVTENISNASQEAENLAADPSQVPSAEKLCVTHDDCTATKSPPTVPHRLRNINPESNPYNSMSGQRKAKVVANNIMKGARKKTVRNLKLPEPDKLGLAHVEVNGNHDTGNSGCGSDSEDDFAYIDEAIQGPSLVLAQALQQPGNVASALVTIDIARSSQKADNHTVECNKSEERKFIHKENEEPKQKQENHPKITKIETLGINGNIAINRQNNTHRNTQTLKDSSLLQVQSEFLSDNKPFVTVQKGEERYQALEERAAKAVNIAQKEAKIGVKPNHQPILRPGLRKDAQRKWSNKLSSLTLHAVQRPPSGKSGSEFSYNLVPSPATVSLPTTSIPKSKTSG